MQATSHEGTLLERISRGPFVADDERADRVMNDLADAVVAVPDCELARIIKPALIDRLLRAVASASPYLTQLCLREPARLELILRAQPEGRFSDLCSDLQREVAACEDFDAAMRLLRLFKAEVALLTAICDLGGVWQVMDVTAVLTRAADAAVEAAVGFLFRRARRAGTWLGGDDASPQVTSGYFVIAMGKHGAFELNYSSDIDLIVFYDLDRAKLREGQDAKTFFVRLTRDLVRLMQERTVDGYVFRTDLRLRPDPSATQAAISTTAGLIYYESFGQNWERAALIKARIIAGDRTAGAQMLHDLTPFIWRKYLDFAAIADVHAMKRQINAWKGFGSIAVAGHNIKLGRGGIREIEFFAQTQQLIAGGRQEDLRIPATLDALQQLVKRGWIEADVCEELTESYLFLRKIEHRLQMLNDEQTQTLPSEPEALEQLALFSDFADTDSFATALRAHLVTVQGHYAALFEDDGASEETGSPLIFSGEEAEPATLSALAEMGYQKADQVLATVRSWHRGRYASVRSQRGREALTEMQSLVVTNLARTADPDRAMIAFDAFLANLPTGVQLFALLKANPSLLRLVADIMGSAPRLARILSRRRRVLDAVLDPGFFGTVPSEQDLSRLIDDELGPIDSYEEALDRARIIGNEQMFLIGVRVLSGTISAALAGGVYAALAERLIAAMLAKVRGAMTDAHGSIEKGGAAVIAMGKLGGHEMTAASDLDLILVYDFEPGTQQSESAGATIRPLSPNLYYSRVTQRLISALSVPTAEGTIYEVDLRLRPSGHKGPVATQLSSFIAYQTSEAWTWEHMALTRARVVSGPAELRARLEDIIADVLTRPRDRKQIAADVRDMRARIEAEKSTTDIWDLKQVRGGILDIEFITQFLQLVNAADHPEVLDPNTIAALEKLRDTQALDPASADLLLNAAKLLNNLTQVLRLCLDSSFDRDAALTGLKELLCRAAEVPDFARLEGELRTSQQAVAATFEELVQ